MKNALVLMFFAAACLCGQTSVKTDATAAANQKNLTAAATAGTPIPATINVKDNVNIEAVMLPEEVAHRVFGKEVSEKYAVIEVNISNRSNQAGLIVQSLFIDLHDWGLAGPMGPEGGNSSNSRNYQSNASPLDVSSVEYRIVRGEMLDHQPWTTRNAALRVIEVMGSLGTAFAFPFTRDVVTGIGAWNGAVVPGFEALFPDSMQAQMDRVSDYGFRDNKVIPQQAADILVAFFPIKRFLTSDLRKTFLKNPALFFNPVLMALDPKSRRDLYPTLRLALAVGAKQPKDEEIDAKFAALLGEYAKIQGVVATDTVQYQQDQAKVDRDNAAITQDKAAIEQDKSDPKPAQAVIDQHNLALPTHQAALAADGPKVDTDQDKLRGDWLPLGQDPLYNLLSTISLNNVHVVVSGIMTVDVDSIPPIVNSITCTGDSQPASIWGSAGKRDCAIHGSFLSNGTPVIAEATVLGITAGAVTAGSTDALLNIELTLTKAVPAKSPLTFQVTKKNKQGATVESAKFPYAVPDYIAPGPSITSVAVKDTTVTVTGANFNDTATVTAHAAVPVAVEKIAKPTITATQIQFDDKGFAAACWQVQVKVGSAENAASTDKPPKDQFASAATPKIDTNTLTGSTLKVTGADLLDLSACGGAPLTFQVLSDAAGAKPEAIAKPELTDGKTATLTTPTLAAGAKWKEVDALVSGKPVACAEIGGKSMTCPAPK